MVGISRRVGVVLFQLGGPDSLAAVEPFLYNLFCDPDIIDFPFSRLGRRALARLISKTRAKKASQHYAAIGGSPISRFTEQQASALEAQLMRDGVDVRCVVAMRYWHPFTAEAIAQLQNQDAELDHVVLLPLYPQYSSTTTGSSLNEWRRQWQSAVPTSCVEAFYRDPQYIASVVERIDEALARFPDPPAVPLVFSAHRVPVSVIEKGDAYQRQIEETVRLVMEQGGWSNDIACAIRARWAPADGWSRRCARHCGRWPRRSGAKYASSQFHLSPTMSRPWERLIIMRGRRPSFSASSALR